MRSMSRGSGRGVPTSYKLAALLLIAVLAALFVDYTGIYDIPGLQVGGGEKPSLPGAPGHETPCSYPTAIVTTDVAAWDSLDITTSRSIGTDVDVVWFRYHNGWIKLGAGDGVDLSLTSADNDVVYMALMPSSQYYVDYEEILKMNPHVSWYGYKDITGDGREEFIFKVDISGSTYAEATGKWNMPLVNIYLLTYDSGFAFAPDGKPDDITGIGTSTVTKYLKWWCEISAEKKGVAIYKVVITANTSDISKIKLEKVNIPGVGYLDGGAFTQDVYTDQIMWTYTISQNSLYGASYLKRPVGDPNEFKFTTVVELTLDSDDVIEVTLKIYYLTPTEASAVLSDSVILSAS